MNYFDENNAGEYYIMNMEVIREKNFIEIMNKAYMEIKNTCSFAPKLGEFGCISFINALLLYGYTSFKYRTQRDERFLNLYSESRIIVGSAFFLSSPSVFDERMDIIVKQNEGIINYEEYCRIYQYLKDHYSNQIQEMEFNKGTSSSIKMMELESEFDEIIRKYSSDLNEKVIQIESFFESKGLNI